MYQFHSHEQIPERWEVQKSGHMCLDVCDSKVSHKSKVHMTQTPSTGMTHIVGDKSIDDD
jgi:hypothetical protein